VPVLAIMLPARRRVLRRRFGRGGRRAGAGRRRPRSWWPGGGSMVDGHGTQPRAPHRGQAWSAVSIRAQPLVGLCYWL